jgi:uncharacterized membrane protein
VTHVLPAAIPAQEQRDRQPRTPWYSRFPMAFTDQPMGAWAIAALVTAAYLVFSAAQWNRLESPSWDLGIFTQLAKAYSRFQAPIVPIRGAGFNLLGDHFHPLLAFLGPVYALFPSAFSLLATQDFLIGVSVFVVARTAIRALGSTQGVLLGGAYGISWGIQAAVAVQFHEIAFALPLLALSLEAILRRRWMAAALWAAPLVFVKEDLGLTVALIGAYIAWKAAKPLGVWLVAWGMFWTVAAIGVILPLLNIHGRYGYYGTFGNIHALANPWKAFIGFVTPEQKYQTLGLILLSTGALALRSPIILITVPTLTWRFISTNSVHWGPTWHYSAVLMPIIFIALIDAIRHSRTSSRQWLRSYSRAVIPIVATVALMQLPTQPLGSLVKPETYATPARAEQAHEAMALIPNGAVVESDIALMQYLVPATTVYWLGNPGNPAAGYVVLDRTSGTWGSTPPTNAATYAEEQHPGARYRLIYNDGGYQVAQKQ